MRKLFLILAASALFGIRAKAAPQAPEPPPLEKPKPKSANVSSAETMITLPPPPATPIKRQEKKNPPKPPALITKIRSADDEDWARSPNDLRGLLESMSSEMGVNFTSQVKPFKKVSVNPEDNPVLYRSGYKTFELSTDEISLLRQYLHNGGTIVFNSLVGNPNAYESAKRAAQLLLPEGQLYRLRTDHPLFSSYFQIGEVKFRDRMVRDGVVVDNYPFIEGIDIDNRTAIIISRWDFALGWSKNAHESWGYADEDARHLGANIMAYATAMKKSGQSVGQSVVLENASGTKPAGAVRIGQVKHNGPWKTRETALPMLLGELNKVTGTQVSFEIKQVTLDDPAIFELPFLYLSGTTDFTLTPEEVANLKRYLGNGGVLLAEASEGRDSFDKAFRREIAKVLPQAPLQPFKPGSPVFSSPRQITSARVRPALAAARGNQVEIAPELLGIELDGGVAVVYSPYDLGAGWEKALAPYALGYEPSTATDLGINIFCQALTR